jgi:hypothetical protein
MQEIRYLSRKISVVVPDEDGKDVNEKVWDEYHGSDVDGSGIDLVKGQSAVVSNEKAAQLERDFPDLFEVVREVEGDEPEGTLPPPPLEPEVEPGPVDPRVELLKLTRAKLDKAAKDAGVEEPDKLPNKGAVADAIIDAGDQS